MAQAFLHGQVRHAGMAAHEIEADGKRRHENHGGDHADEPVAEAAAGFEGFLGLPPRLIGGENAPGDVVARRLGLFGRYEAVGDVLFQLAQLILVNGQVVFGPGKNAPGMAQQRNDQREHDNGQHDRDSEPEGGVCRHENPVLPCARIGPPSCTRARPEAGWQAPYFIRQPSSMAAALRMVHDSVSGQRFPFHGTGRRKHSSADWAKAGWQRRPEEGPWQKRRADPRRDPLPTCPPPATGGNLQTTGGQP